MSIIQEYFDFLQKFIFLAKIWIFSQNLDFWSKFGFLAKVWIFGQNLDFWPKFGFLAKIYTCIVNEPFDFWAQILMFA